jgi:hypothetical protein
MSLVAAQAWGLVLRRKRLVLAQMQALRKSNAGDDDDVTIFLYDWFAGVSLVITAYG